MSKHMDEFYYYKKDENNDEKKLLRAIKNACLNFKGSFAIEVLCSDNPNKIIKIFSIINSRKIYM